MKNNSSQKLDIIRNHIPRKHFTFYFYLRSNHPFTCLFYRSKCLWQNNIQSFSRRNSIFKFLSFGFYLIIRKLVKLSGESVYLFDHWLKFVELFLIVVSSNEADNFPKHNIFLKLLKIYPLLRIVYLYYKFQELKQWIFSTRHYTILSFFQKIIFYFFIFYLQNIFC